MSVGCRDGHYCLTSKRIETVGGFQVNSQLTVIGVNSRDTGSVECRATYGNGAAARSLTMATTLTVIGEFVELKSTLFFSRCYFEVNSAMGLGLSQ